MLSTWAWEAELKIIFYVLVLVDPLSKAIGYRETLYLFFPGLVFASKLTRFAVALKLILCTKTQQLSQIKSRKLI